MIFHPLPITQERSTGRHYQQSIHKEVFHV